MTILNPTPPDVLLDAQRRGLISDLPLDDIMLAANSVVMGLANSIINGHLGEVDDARATELAIAVTGVFGQGLFPRKEKITDDFNRSIWQPQIEGSRSGRELPGIVDQVV